MSMKKIILISLLLVFGWLSAGAVDLNKDNRDPQYVESIVKRSQKIVDKLGLTDVKVAEDVRNVIANRYFELNDILFPMQNWFCRKIRYINLIVISSRQKMMRLGQSKTRTAGELMVRQNVLWLHLLQW